MIISCLLTGVVKTYTLLVQHFSSSVRHCLTKLKICIVLDLVIPFLVIYPDKCTYTRVQRYMYKDAYCNAVIGGKKLSEGLLIRKYFNNF